MRKTAFLVAAVCAAAAAALVLAIQSAGKEGAPGFFGPGALIADVNLALEILLVLGLTAGMFLARSGRIEAHRVNQTVWVLVNAVLVALIMVSSLQDVKIEQAADLASPRHAVTWLHASIGTLAAAAGVWLVLQMNDVLPRRLHVAAWKTLMRVTLAGYWTVALLGFAVYWFWYVA